MFVYGKLIVIKIRSNSEECWISYTKKKRCEFKVFEGMEVIVGEMPMKNKKI